MNSNRKHNSVGIFKEKLAYRIFGKLNIFWTSIYRTSANLGTQFFVRYSETTWCGIKINFLRKIKFLKNIFCCRPMSKKYSKICQVFQKFRLSYRIVLMRHPVVSRNLTKTGEQISAVFLQNACITICQRIFFTNFCLWCSEQNKVSSHLWAEATAVTTSDPCHVTSQRWRNCVVTSSAWRPLLGDNGDHSRLVR